MSRPGVWFAAHFLLGIVAESTVLPLPVVPPAIAALTLTLAATAWPPLAAVSVGLAGLTRSAAARRDFDALRLRASHRAHGSFLVLREEGDGAVVRVGARTVRLSERPPDFPPPGAHGRGYLRLDPIEGRYDPSAFRADRWARTRGFHARARCLTLDPLPGAHAADPIRAFAFTVRERARRVLGEGPGAGIVRALVLGDRSALGDATQSDFRRAGLAHVLALSGMHVGILSLGVAALLRAVRAPRAMVTLVVLLFLVAFVGLTGAKPPIVRAACTGAVGFVAVFLGRTHDPLNALGWAAVGLLIVEPALGADPGAQLSFVATAVLGYAATRPRRVTPVRAGGRWWRETLDGVRLSTAVTVATAPILAGAFGAVSVLSPLTNLFATLPASAALAWGALAAFGPVPGEWLAPFARAAGAAGVALEALSAAASRYLGGELPLPSFGLAGTLVALGVTRRLCEWQRPSRRDIGLLAVLGAFAAAPLAPHFVAVDVGQGDCFLLGAEGETIVVDAGVPDREGGDSAGARAVRHRYLRPPRALIATHGHADHIGGFATFSSASPLLVPPAETARPGLLTALMERHVSTVVERETHLNDAIRVDPGPPRAGLSENDRSLRTRACVGPATVLLLGDISADREHDLLTDGGVNPATILVTPHHGSRDSGSPELLAAARPELLVISCGRGNPHGHPHAELLARVAAAGTLLRRTDWHGSVTVRAAGSGLRLRWERGWPGSESLFPRFRFREAADVP